MVAFVWTSDDCRCLDYVLYRTEPREQIVRVCIDWLYIWAVLGGSIGAFTMDYSLYSGVKITIFQRIPMKIKQFLIWCSSLCLLILHAILIWPIYFGVLPAPDGILSSVRYGFRQWSIENFVKHFQLNFTWPNMFHEWSCTLFLDLYFFINLVVTREFRVMTDEFLVNAGTSFVYLIFGNILVIQHGVHG